MVIFDVANNAVNAMMMQYLMADVFFTNRMFYLSNHIRVPDSCGDLDFPLNARSFVDQDLTAPVGSAPLFQTGPLLA